MLNKYLTKKNILICSVILLVVITITSLIYLFYTNQTKTNIQPQTVEQVQTPPNIILLIGDGMGTEHIKLIKKYEGTMEEGYIFETCPNTTVTTNSLTQDSPTDSAAAGTAIATGVKVLNGVLSVGEQESDLKTILEILKEEGYLTGLVTTTDITNATPAAFASHTLSRTNEEEILQDYFISKPDIIFGGLTEEYVNYITEEYSIATNKEELTSLDQVF